MLERYSKTQVDGPVVPRRRILVGAAAALGALALNRTPLGRAAASLFETPAAAEPTDPHNSADIPEHDSSLDEGHGIQEDGHGEEKHKNERFSLLGFGVLAEHMASFAQIIKRGHFTPFTSARSIANLYATTAVLNGFGNEADKHMAEEMRLEFTGEKIGPIPINIALMGALPYITNVTKHIRVVTGNIIAGMPHEHIYGPQSDEESPQYKASFGSKIRDLIQPKKIDVKDQLAINKLFKSDVQPDVQESERPVENIQLDSINASRINALILKDMRESGEISESTREALATLESMFAKHVKRLIGRGTALIDASAPLGTTYLSTQIGNELCAEVLEYKYRHEYVKRLRQNSDELQKLPTDPAFEPQAMDQVAPPSHLDEGHMSLEHQALFAADEKVNDLRTFLGARIARGGNGSGVFWAGDPPNFFAIAESAKRGTLAKFMAVSTVTGLADTLANGALTSAQLAHRILAEDAVSFQDDVINQGHAVQAYAEGASIMTQKILGSLRHPALSLRRITTGTDVDISKFASSASGSLSDSPTPEEYSAQIVKFLEQIQNGTDPNVVVPIGKIARQSVLGLAHSCKDAVAANIELFTTAAGRKNLVDRYVKLTPPSHEQHHQSPDDLILQGEAVEYDEILRRMTSWAPRDQLRYLRSIAYKYAKPEDFINAIASEGDERVHNTLGALFAEDVLTDHPEIEGYMLLIHSTAQGFVDMLKGKKSTEDTPITARELSPEITKIFSEFTASTQVADFIAQQAPPLAEDKLVDQSLAKAEYVIPYNELESLTENAKEVLFALTSQMPHVGAIIETAKLLLEGFDKTLTRMGVDVKTKAQLKFALNTTLVAGVSSVADNAAAFLFGVKTGELIVDDLAAADESISAAEVEALKFAAFMTAMSTAVHAGQNFKPGNGPNFSVARAVPDVAKLVVLNSAGSRLGAADQIAENIPLIDKNDDMLSSEEAEAISNAAATLRTREDDGFIKPIRITKVSGWTADKYALALRRYGLYMSEERIERFIMGHPENSMVIVARPKHLENGHVNTHPTSLGLKESIETTRHWPVQGLGAPAVWLGNTVRKFASVG